ncbi:MAG: YbhB/YbcL family Raf kinase inhibitor-like protein [Acidobacteriota bacterium]|nr:YbhB/YbcL family Raf kinase inhibitor-like protein [Acidobacteriota bacterium]
MIHSVIARSLGAAALVLGVCGLVAAQQSGPARRAPGPSLVLSSASFPDASPIPVKYTCAATEPPPSGPRHISTGVSPELEWKNPPQGTVSFVLILHDPDARIPKAATDITHWIAFNIPASATMLPEAVSPEAPLPGGGLQGTNITGKAAYQGPCAGPGAYHHYTFELLAVDKTLDLPQGATREQIEDAIKGHVLGNAAYVGLFHR